MSNGSDQQHRTPSGSVYAEPATVVSALGQILDDMPDGILLLDQDWRITYANRTACTISRLTPQDFNSKTHWELYPETIGTSVEVAYNEVMTKRVERHISALYYAPFKIWLDVRVLPAKGGGIALHYRDVTENHRLLEATRHSDEMAKIALAAVKSVGTWDWDLLTDIVYSDERFASLYGVDPKRSASGAPRDEFLRNVILTTESSARMATAIQTGGEFVVEYRISQADNSLCWVSVHGRCTLDSNGRPFRASGIVIDITERKRAEAALIKSEKLAAVGRMASSIAHEINNPLESVTNLIFIARTYATVPEVQNLLDLADQELRRVATITNQTLRFHKQASSPREISCADLLGTVLSLYEGRLRNSSIQVERRKRSQRLISCFEGDVRQVLNNLVSNAIDAMPKGGRLLLRSREATDWRTGRRGIVLTVADDGTGITPDVRTHIFEAFFTTKGHQGTGLGLWISTEILERHQGRLLLRSSPAPHLHGTVCNVFLPFESALSTSASPLIQ